jgi:hypothetical protein
MPNISQKENGCCKKGDFERFHHGRDEWIIELIELAVTNVLLVVVGPLFDSLNDMKFVRKGNLTNHVERQGQQVRGQINLSWIRPLLVVVVNGHGPTVDKFRNKGRNASRKGLFNGVGLKGWLSCKVIKLSPILLARQLPSFPNRQSFLPAGAVRISFAICLSNMSK